MNLDAHLLALVPEDGSSIGNQSLLERVRALKPDITEAEFLSAREQLLEQGLLCEAGIS